MAAALHSRCSYWLVAANRLDDNSVESRAEARTNNDNHAVGPQITLNRPHNLYLSLSGDVRYDIMPFSASQFTLETANTHMADTVGLDALTPRHGMHRHYEFINISFESLHIFL